MMVQVISSANPNVETQAERDALNKVKVNSFSVVPANVSPYGTVTATWDVTLPTDTPFDVLLTLHEQEVSAQGSMTFRMATQSQSFTLRAVINDPPLPFAARILKTLTVVVNTTGCADIPYPTSAVTDLIKQGMDEGFSSGDNFTLNDGDQL